MGKQSKNSIIDQRISHTYCQAAPTNAISKAWQRVCLPNRTSKTTDKPKDEKEQRTDNNSNRCTTPQKIYSEVSELK